MSQQNYNLKREVVMVDDEIFATFEEIDSDDEGEGMQKFLVDFASATGFRSSSELRTEGTKLQAQENSSVFSQSTFADSIPNKSTKKDNSKPKHQPEDSNDDTPITINKPSLVAPTEAISSISKEDDISRKLDALTKALLEMSSKMASLEGLQNSTQPQRAGNSSGSDSLGDSVLEAAPL